MAGLPAGAREKLPAIRQAIQAFAAELRGELSAAIEKGGATLAIGVCRDRAPEIARRPFGAARRDARAHEFACAQYGQRAG